MYEILAKMSIAEKNSNQNFDARAIDACPQKVGLDQLENPLLSGDRGQGFDPHPLQGRRSSGAASPPLGRVRLSTSYLPHYLVEDGIG
nr:hypothetical protein [Tanacetum cinerariifolium]